MILDLHCQSLDLGIERGSFGNCPGLQNSVDLEPEIVVKRGGAVFLNNEEATRSWCCFFFGPGSGVLLKCRFFLYSVRDAISCDVILGLWSRLDVIL